MSNVFTIAASLDGVQPLKDGGVSLRFHTQETSTADKVTLMEFYQSFGWVMFSANQISEDNIPKTSASSDQGKSPSQRLRAVLYVYWQQQGGKGDFEAFYNQNLEYVINTYKEKLT